MSSSSSQPPFVVLLGTDPEVSRGGVSSALQGFELALEARGIAHTILPTHHNRSAWGKLWPFLVACARLPGILRRVKREGYRPVVYAHAGDWPSLLRKFTLLAIARAFGALRLLHLHAQDVVLYLEGNVSGFVFRRAMTLTTDHLCVLSDWWREHLMASRVQGPISVVPNPLASWEHALESGAPPRPGPPIRILTLTRLVPGKGVDTAIQAITLLDERYSLTIAGDGPQRRSYETLAQELGVADRVNFVGWVANDAKTAAFHDADIFCVPSCYESFGMGFLEAMAFGLPVVAVAWGAIADVVPHGRVGLLVDRQDPSLVAEALTRLGDSSLRRSLGASAKAWVCERYTPERVGTLIETVISETGQGS